MSCSKERRRIWSMSSCTKSKERIRFKKKIKSQYQLAHLTKLFQCVHVTFSNSRVQQHSPGEPHGRWQGEGIFLLFFTVDFKSSKGAAGETTFGLREMQTALAENRAWEKPWRPEGKGGRNSTWASKARKTNRREKKRKKNGQRRKHRDVAVGWLESIFSSVCLLIQTEWKIARDSECNPPPPRRFPVYLNRSSR